MCACDANFRARKPFTVMAGRPRAPTRIVQDAEVKAVEDLKDEVWINDDLHPELSADSLHWCAIRGLVRNQVLCHKCGSQLSLVNYQQSLGGKRWVCPTRRCNVVKIECMVSYHFSKFTLYCGERN